MGINQGSRQPSYAGPLEEKNKCCGYRFALGASPNQATFNYPLTVGQIMLEQFAVCCVRGQLRDMTQWEKSTGVNNESDCI